jgi:anion-transporting  ArsA/GET3 family ATPase
MGLLDRRVVLVTGKGGVGKTAVAAAIAMEASRRGLRVLLAETQGARRAPQLFDRPDTGYDVNKLQENLYTLSIDSESAIEDYVLQQIKVRALYKLVFKNRVMGPFMRALPGLHDLIQVGKVWDLERLERRGRREWDLIVVDAPATGHGLSMLDSPRSMMDLTVAGPFHENAARVRELLEDPARTGLVLVALPEEMPVSETLDLYGRLGRFQPQVALCVLNKVSPPPMTHIADWPAVRDALLDGAPDARLEGAVDFTDWAVARERRTQEARQRLRRGLPVHHAELPLLLRPALSPPDIAALGERLAEVM